MRNNVIKTSAIFMAAAMMITAALTGCSGSSNEPTAASNAGTTDGTPADIQNIINAGKLKVGCKVDIPNFSLLNAATGKYEGYENDLAYIIAGEIFGCTPEEAKEKDLVAFQGVNAKTRGPLLDNGEVDLVIATFTITEERKETYNFSRPYYTDAVGLLVLKSSGINSIADLDRKVIGVSRGSISKDCLIDYTKENGIPVTPEFEEFDTYPELATALSSKNIDVFCVDRAILSGYNDDTTNLLPDRFAEQEYGVVSKKENTGLADLVEGVVSELESSGAMEKMLADWGIN